ncbi:APC family permease [Nocardioides sp.]|uniref:APC family permease n=1 Tax=Nocardioides sp. TaxID=35761 RepID=UPI00356B59C7
MTTDATKLSLAGSVSLGTGVMIGAGIFALVGQVSELAGSLMPVAFLVGAVVVGFSAYSYATYSNANPSSGGIAMLLKAAYGPGVIAGSFSFFMYVSMVVAQSLLARTFGTYSLRPFDLAGSAVLVPLLGVAVIAVAAVVNVVGTGLVERSATVTAAIKIAGISALAIAAIVATGASGFGNLVDRAESGGQGQGVLGFLAGTTLCILAYKGFTTITNQGGDLRDPRTNLGRSITIAIALCAALYLLLTVSIAASLPVDRIVEARDYALAAAAEPLFGPWGVWLTIALAVVATFSGLLASIYSVSRLYDMLRDMNQAPELPFSVRHQSLLITVGLAMVVTVFLDLSRIAAMGALLYIAMDIAVHWGVIRHLSVDIGARRWVPAVAIVLDGVVLGSFVVVKLRTDPLTVGVGVAVAAAIVLSQWVVVRRRDARST